MAIEQSDSLNSGNPLIQKELQNLHRVVENNLEENSDYKIYDALIKNTSKKVTGIQVQSRETKTGEGFGKSYPEDKNTELNKEVIGSFILLYPDGIDRDYIELIKKDIISIDNDEIRKQAADIHGINHNDLGKYSKIGKIITITPGSLSQIIGQNEGILGIVTNISYQGNREVSFAIGGILENNKTDTESFFGPSSLIHEIYGHIWTDHPEYPHKGWIHINAFQESMANLVANILTGSKGYGSFDTNIFSLITDYLVGYHNIPIYTQVAYGNFATFLTYLYIQYPTKYRDFIKQIDENFKTKDPVGQIKNTSSKEYAQQLENIICASIANGDQTVFDEVMMGFLRYIITNFPFSSSSFGTITDSVTNPVGFKFTDNEDHIIKPGSIYPIKLIVSSITGGYLNIGLSNSQNSKYLKGYIKNTKTGDTKPRSADQKNYELQNGSYELYITNTALDRNNNISTRAALSTEKQSDLKIPELPDIHLDVYPNPLVRGQYIKLNMSYDQNVDIGRKSGNIKIYNMLGQEVFEIPEYSLNDGFQLPANITAGVYILYFEYYTSGGGYRQFSKRFVVQ